MKKIFTAALFLLSASSLFAQNKITYKVNGLNAGDVRAMKQIEYQPQGNGGANQYWNFSGAKEVKAMSIAQAENVATQIGNIDLSSRNTLLAVDEGGEKTTYFEITNTEKRYWGLSHGAVKIEFEQPIVDMKFPMAYQDVISGSMNGSYNTGATVEPITGSYTSEADAWGTLELPDGNIYNNVLRVKLTKNYQQQSGSLTYTIQTVRYQYYAEGVRYPVLIVLENHVASDCNCTCGNYTTEQAYYLPGAQAESKQVLSGKSVADNSVRINVYPNPFRETLNASVKINNATEANVDIVDAAGRKIKDFGSYNLVEGENAVTLETADIVPGNYFIRVSVDGVNYAKGVFKK
ncbi:MAG: T9SS type A sorting domain-containing protein [Paludibacteraceae bacterium]|nr:T9SS type A sorting domain-containing protein [Paludibacteraceae bacterium]